MLGVIKIIRRACVIPSYWLYPMKNISELLTPVFDLPSIRAIEQASFSSEGGSYPMMERAARVLFHHISRRFKEVQTFTVLCGSGNNGGDGALLAVLLANAGLTVRGLDLASKERSGDAKKAWAALLASDVEVFVSNTLDDDTCFNGVIIDAMLGIGGSAFLSGEFERVCRWVNKSRQSGARVVAVDSPTGLDVATGLADPNTVVADVTVTFIRDKQGFYINQGLVCVGEVICERLESVDLLAEKGDKLVGAVGALWFEASDVRLLSPCARYPVSHKGSYGHISVVGGDDGYGGAVIMAASGAARTGAGTVSVLTRDNHIAPVLARIPSVMAVTPDGEDIKGTLRNLDSVLLIGPGLGRKQWGEALFQQALELTHRKVLDADALHWLSLNPIASFRGLVVLTPHVGEAAKLLDTTPDGVSGDLIGSAKALSQRYGAIVVLKGVSSVISAPDGRTVIAGRPCPGLAKGGSGDVLSGMVSSCLAYYQNPFEAVVIAVAWHNVAAQKASQELGEIHMQPYELLDYLRLS
ncbi:YjeF-related protein [Marinomonas mediterranea MMB-1]|jgi:yjeF C-terminal region, hydroxyethylthiazole kinase-related|uniref:ADP-dependent (S)-NAD(P)H-hydrate dehydratase n=2 Tax=Marinomonas mediterranea TaxID=119864 RepID=F2JWM1_MARM1|nr:YjeF-related protein [Marinomonas mediterranea MMB-1]